MLHLETVDHETLRLLKELQSLPELANFSLVGGTSLALQIGHRISIDLDLFSNGSTSIENLLSILNKKYDVKVIAYDKSVLACFINDVKVDIVNYQYKLLDRYKVEDKIRLAAMKDIAAMKLAAVVGQGTRKDFIDLYFLLETFSLTEMIQYYLDKYQDASELMLLKSIVYFDDAELQPMPQMLIPIEWQTIKEKLQIVSSKLLDS